MSKVPSVGEGAVPVRLRLHLPDGKRLADTTDWAGWKTKNIRESGALKTKYPGLAWPRRRPLGFQISDFRFE